MLVECCAWKVLRLPDALLNQIKQWMAGAEESASARVLSAVEKLESAGMLIAQNLVFQAGRRALRSVVRHELVTEIHPTSSCNLACKYCFQEQLLTRRGPMTAPTVQATLSWCEQLISSEGLQAINTTYMGGEPSLAVDTVVGLHSGLRAMADKFGIPFRHCMTSNGTGLTDANCAKLAAAGATDVYVSLDGPGRVHDGRRPFRNGQGSFAAAIAGVECALRHSFNVTALIMADQDTAMGMDDLARVLMEIAGRHERRVNITFLRRNLRHHDLGESWGCDAVDVEAFMRQNAASRLKAFDALAKIAGAAFGEVDFSPQGGSQPAIGVSQCMFWEPYGMVITASGDIYKCEEGAGLGHFYVGNVESMSIPAYARRCEELLADPFWEKPPCDECCYLPLCRGGCLNQRQIAQPAGLNWCEKAYWDTFITGLVERFYDPPREGRETDTAAGVDGEANGKQAGVASSASI